MSVFLSRRQRYVVLTAGLAVAFLISTAVVLWAVAPAKEVYRPGEAVEGLTDALARDLPADHPRVSFTDVTSAAGIAFRHFSGRRTSQLPEDMGSGAAWGDYDGDGWLDLFVVNQAGPITMTPAEVAASPARSALYRNRGDGTFAEVAEAAGVAFRGWGMGAAWGDADGDGRLDLFVTAYGENVFYHNRGDGTFAERTAEAGLGGQNGFWTGASWADYDRDGDLDLYVVGYVRYDVQAGAAASRQYDAEVPASLNPSSFAPERNLLYRNRGDGTFTEVAAAAGVDNPAGRGFAAAWADLDADGWPDLYVANDVSDNALYRNLGDGTFEDVSHPAMVADHRGAMGLAVGDWDGDTDFDLFVTHWIAQENALYRSLVADGARLGVAQLNTFQFMDEADRYGLGQVALDFVGWGTAFFDYDNDGRLDLFVANGSTFQQPEAPYLLVPMQAQLFWNRGDAEGFFDVSPVAGDYFARALVGRGAAFADYDNDGDVDVSVVHNGGPGVLLRNDAGAGGSGSGHWLEVALEGRRSNRQGIGARLRVVAGGRVQVRQVGAQPSYCSQNSMVEHVGLGAAARVDTLEIAWPSGLRQVFTGLAADRIVRVVEGEALALAEGSL